jgi:hypothetical protein
MKKILLTIVMLRFGMGMLQAQGIDFTEYPELINNGTVFINMGAGYGTAWLNKLRIPPLTLSIDYALPLMSLPFSIGIGGTYSTEKEGPRSSTNLGVNFRLAYHLGWGLDNLDTYALIGMGAVAGWFDTGVEWDPWFWFGGGARYFFTSFFGAYVELGYKRIYVVSAGISFKL